jgi:hypothetical protein
LVIAKLDRWCVIVQRAALIHFQSLTANNPSFPTTLTLWGEGKSGGAGGKLLKNLLHSLPLNKSGEKPSSPPLLHPTRETKVEGMNADLIFPPLSIERKGEKLFFDTITIFCSRDGGEGAPDNNSHIVFNEWSNRRIIVII